MNIYIQFRSRIAGVWQRGSIRYKGAISAVIILSWASVFTYGQRQQGNQPTFDEVLARGTAAARAGNLRSAETAFREATSIRPHDPRALTALGQVQEQSGQYSAALQTFQAVVRTDSRSSDAHVNLAVTLADQGQLAAGMQEAAIALSLNPQSVGAHFLHGRLLNDQGQHQEARKEFKEALRLSPHDTEILRYWADLESEVGDRHAEAGLLKEYLAQRPDDAEAQFRFGQLMHEEQNNKEAIPAWEKAIAVNPGYREALYSLGRALKDSDPSKGRALLAQAAALGNDENLNDQVRLLGNAANDKMSVSDYVGAIETIKQAIILCGHCKSLGPLEKNLGLAYCHKGELDRCQRELRIAESLIPEDPDVADAIKIAKEQQKAGSRSP